jgi:hypothetical protein
MVACCWLLCSNPLVAKPRFDAIAWDGETITIDGVAFRVYEEFGAPPALAGNTLWLFKGRPLLEDYFAVFQRDGGLEVHNLFELGIWESGSVAFWTQLFRPDKHVAVDLAAPREPAAFRRFLRDHDLKSRVSTHWLTNQADDTKLRELLSREFLGPLDLVIDDASHCLEPTKAGLASLLPAVREGGLFIVEDWAWALVPVVRRAFPAEEPGLVPLIDALLPLAHLEPALVRSIEVRPTLFVIERGAMTEPDARALLFERLRPRFEASPGRLTRIVKGSVLWQLARRARRRIRGQ